MELKLYVGNLNFHTTEAMLAEAFAEAGYVTVSVKVITDRETGRSRGFAFVELADEQTAQAALTGMHDKLVDGRPLKVTEAKPRGTGGFSGPPRGPGGPGGDFRPPRPRPSFDERGGSGGYEGRGGGGGQENRGGFDNRGGGGQEGRGGYDNRGGGGYDSRGPGGGGAPDSRGGYEPRPRFGGDAGRGPRDAGGFGGGPRSYGGFPPAQPPGFGQTSDEEAKGDPRVNRGKRRDLSKQHAERQDADDDDGWA